MTQAVDEARPTVEKTWVTRTIWALGSFVALILIWQVLATVMGTRLFPAPLLETTSINEITGKTEPVPSVIGTMVRESATGELFFHVGMTLMRVAFAFVLAMFIGSAIGIAMGRSKLTNQVFDTWLIFFLNLPALVTIILCYLWLGPTEVAAVAAVAINKIPNVAVTLREGARSLSRDLVEMAQVYRFGTWKTLRHVTIPQLAPFFSAAARTGLSLVWKIVLVVELIGRSNGVGHELHIAFQNFDVARILAYAIAFILVVQVIEMTILQPADERANKWRR